MKYIYDLDTLKFYKPKHKHTFIYYFAISSVIFFNLCLCAIIYLSSNNKMVNKNIKVTIEPTKSSSYKVDNTLIQYAHLPQGEAKVFEDEYLTTLYNQLNKTYFNNSIHIDYIGYCNEFDSSKYLALTVHALYNGINENGILVHPDTLVTNDEDMKSIILHEMCHVYSNEYDKNAKQFLYSKNVDCHNYPLFIQQVQRLKSLGLNVAGY